VHVTDDELIISRERSLTRALLPSGSRSICSKPNLLRTRLVRSTMMVLSSTTRTGAVDRHALVPFLPLRGLVEERWRTDVLLFEDRPKVDAHE
jgi:hypothetical protein